MPLQEAVRQVFGQLAGSLDLMSQDEFVKPCVHLSNSTIGQHVRHIIEMFQCLELGYEAGTVNYEQRKRDRLIETDKSVASNALQQIFEGLNKPDKSMMLEGMYNDHADTLIQIPTNQIFSLFHELSCLFFVLTF